MARRATVIKEARAKGESVLLLDAGNSLVTNDAGSNEPAERTKGQTSVEILNRLGYDAVALGERDLLLGKEDLLKRLAEAKTFTFISANLMDKGTNKLVARPYVIKDIAKHRVALIGLTGSVAGGALEGSKDFAIVPPLEAARDYVQRVQSQADIVILLSNAGAEANKAIATQVPGIDLIISGGMEPLEEPAQPVPGTLVAQAEVSAPGHAGRYIGKLQAVFDDSGKLVQRKWENIELNPSVADDADMSNWVKSLPTP